MKHTNVKTSGSLTPECRAPESLSSLFSAFRGIWGKFQKLWSGKVPSFEVSQTWALPPVCYEAWNQLLRLYMPTYPF